MPPKNTVLGNLVAFRVRLASQSPNQIDFYGSPPLTLGTRWGPWATQLNQTGQPECQKLASQKASKIQGVAVGVGEKWTEVNPLWHTEAQMD